MKKIKNLAFAVLGVLLVSVGFVSCEKEYEVTDVIIESTAKSKQSSLSLADLGRLHNLGLNYLRTNHSFTENNTSDFIVDNSIGLLNINDFDTDLLKCKGIDSLNLSKGIKEALEENYLSEPNKLNELVFNNSVAGVVEQNQIQSIQNSIDTAITNNDVLYLKSKLEEHISIYENTTWEENEGSLVGGYLYLLSGSLDYWNGEINSGGNNNKQTLVFAQVDGAGYLYGWFKAWAIDKYQNEECRIRAGLTMGLQFSFVRGLGYVIK